MKRANADEEIKQHSNTDYGTLSPELLNRLHQIVDESNVVEVQQKCQASGTLSLELLECLAYAMSVPQAEIASTIVRKFPKDEKVVRTMLEAIDSGGALPVIKQWTALQSKEYEAVYKVFEKDDKYKTYHYTGYLYAILHHSLPKIWGAEDNKSAIENMWPVDMWRSEVTLDEKDMQLATTAIQASINRQDTVFTTQPAKFMECFIHAVVTKAVETRLIEARDGKLVQEKNT